MDKTRVTTSTLNPFYSREEIAPTQRFTSPRKTLEDLPVSEAEFLYPAHAEAQRMYKARHVVPVNEDTEQVA